MKNFIKTAFVILLLLLASCKQPEGRGSGGAHYESEAYKTVVKNIEEMAKGFWSKAAYDEIKTKQISGLRSESERSSATSLLEAEYGKQLVRDAMQILKGGCSVNRAHSLLKDMMGELKERSNVPGFADLKSLYDNHTKVSKFVSSAGARQKNVTYKTPYDEGYDTQLKEQAKRYLNGSQLYCNTLNSSLKKLADGSSSVYAQRRLWHSQDVVKSYLSTMNINQRELNIALSNLSYEYSTAPSRKDSVNRWSHLMQQHFRKMKNLIN